MKRMGHERLALEHIARKAAWARKFLLEHSDENQRTYALTLFLEGVECELELLDV